MAGISPLGILILMATTILEQWAGHLPFPDKLLCSGEKHEKVSLVCRRTCVSFGDYWLFKELVQMGTTERK